MSSTPAPGRRATLQWVEAHRTVNLNVRCNRGSGTLQLAEPTDIESAQDLFKLPSKASVSEKEMCVYNINIPSVYGCPVTAADVQESAFRSAIQMAETVVLVAILAAAAVAGVQVYRQRRRVSLLVPLVVAGDQAAWSTLVRMIFSLSGDKPGDKRSKAEGDRPRKFAGAGVAYPPGGAAGYGAAAPAAFQQSTGPMLSPRAAHRWSD